MKDRNGEFKYVRPDESAIAGFDTYVDEEESVFDRIKGNMFLIADIVIYGGEKEIKAMKL